MGSAEAIAGRAIVIMRILMAGYMTGSSGSFAWQVLGGRADCRAICAIDNVAQPSPQSDARRDVPVLLVDVNIL